MLILEMMFMNLIMFEEIGVMVNIFFMNGCRYCVSMCFV